MKTSQKYGMNILCELVFTLYCSIAQIPETLFMGMDELKELSLINLGIAYINKDAFNSLQDSLTMLELRYNQMRTIPFIAINILSHLECLDISGNDIKTLSDSQTIVLSASLKRLKRLRVNRKLAEL